MHACRSTLEDPTGVGCWLAVRPARPVVLGGVAGALLAFTTLVSEVSPLIAGPWLVLLVVAAARGAGASAHRTGWAMTLAAAPSVAVLGALALAGRATPAMVTALERGAPPEIAGHGSVFVYLGDTFRGSVDRVVEGPTRLAVSVVVGALLVALVVWWARAALPYARSCFAWILPTRGLRRAWWIGTIGAASLLFALGLDTLRWVSSVGFAAVVTVAGIVLLTSVSRERPPGSGAWQRPIPSHPTLTLPAVFTVGVGVYLALLPPLPNWVRDAGAAAELLLGVPRAT